MKLKGFLYWTPRIISILLTLLFYTFVLDTFSDQFNISSFLMSLVPGTIMFLTLLLSWKWENFGLLFLFYGLGYLGLALSRGFNWITILIFSVPLVFVGILFTFSFLKSDKKERAR